MIPRLQSHHLPRVLLGLLLLALFASACGSPEVVYWVPPLSSPTPPYYLDRPTATPETESTPTEALLPGEGVGSGSEFAEILASPTATPEPLPTATLPPEPPADTEASAPVPETPEPPAPTAPVDTGPTLTPPAVDSSPFLYYAQAADTLPVVAIRFGVSPEEITSPDPIPERDFINPGQLLVIPRRLANTTSSEHLIPDSEVVFSPSAVDFDIAAFAAEAGGKLGVYQEYLKSTGMTSGANVVYRVAIENSVNPRLLLALLEFQGGWVYGNPTDRALQDYPMGLVDPRHKGLYQQLVWAVNHLSTGYYAYREGRLTHIRFKNGLSTRLAPDLNAGTAALQYYFSQYYDVEDWVAALDPQDGFPALYERMFSSMWERAERVEPLFPSGITQPPLTLPFLRNWVWSYTGGPHGAWERDGAYAALDFAPGTTVTGCNQSVTYAVASASGLVVRSGGGVVVLDLDGDGYEQTGWVLVYLHLSSEDRIPVGTWVDAGDPLGHPSCEGGISTGTHLHIARKYNGEWIPADGPLPFNLGGWVASAGEIAYKGTMTRGDETVVACTCSNATSNLIRRDDDP